MRSESSMALAGRPLGILIGMVPIMANGWPSRRAQVSGTHGIPEIEGHRRAAKTAVHHARHLTYDTPT